MLQDTSTAAYDSIRDKLNEKQRVVRRLLLQNPEGLTNEQIARQLSIPINRVTGRIFELREMGVVIDAGTTTSPSTGRRVHVWKLKYPTPTTPSPAKAEGTSKQASLLA
jgi:predicted ArsR family transcriptional regulator